MNKKVIIALVAVLVVAVGAIVWVLASNNDPVPVVNNGEQNEENVKNPDGENNEELDEGVLPNTITKSGIIKSTGKNKVVINGENGKEITIYITEDTEIYGPDGMERTLDDLTVGTDITVDIDGNEYDNNDTKFDALIIYIAGK